MKFYLRIYLLLKDKMVLRTKNFNIFGVDWKIRLLGGILKNQYIRGDCLKRGDWRVYWFNKGGWQERGGVFEGGIDTPMPTMIILSQLELSRIDLAKLNSSILMETVTIPIGQVDEFYFYMHYLIKAWLFEKIIFELVCLFHIVLKSLVSY